MKGLLSQDVGKSLTLKNLKKKNRKPFPLGKYFVQISMLSSNRKCARTTFYIQERENLNPHCLRHSSQWRCAIEIKSRALEEEETNYHLWTLHLFIHSAFLYGLLQMLLLILRMQWPNTQDQIPSHLYVTLFCGSLIFSTKCHTGLYGTSGWIMIIETKYNEGINKIEGYILIL